MTAVNMTAGTLTLNLNGITTTLTNAFDAALGEYVGIQIALNSTTRQTRVVPGRIHLQSSGSGLATINAQAGYGTLTLTDTAGTSAVELNSGGNKGIVSFGGDFDGTNYIVRGQLRLSGSTSSGSPVSAATHKIPIYNQFGTLLNYLYLYP
jgi:hypothetical protein